jgi:hypothetical protein
MKRRKPVNLETIRKQIDMLKVFLVFRLSDPIP